jgi:hypothetical protein
MALKFYHIDDKKFHKRQLNANTLNKAKTEAKKKEFMDFYQFNTKTGQTRYYYNANYGNPYQPLWKSKLIKNKRR